MSQNPSPAMPLQMGLEIECLLVLHNYPINSNLETEQRAIYQQIAKEFNTYMETTSVERMVVEQDLQASTTAQAEGGNEFKNWTIGDDISVRPDDENTTQVPVEITSPIILNNNGVHWKAQVRKFWDFFQHFSTEIQTNDTCGTHVHISLSESTSWSLGNLKRLSMAIIWFEPAIEVILPKQRRQNKWAKANHKDHPQFKAQTIENIFHMIHSCETTDALIDCMNPQDDRYFGWNFTNLRKDAIGTVEFRRPPGVVGRATCLSWMEFTAAFARAAVNVQDPTDLIKYQQSVEGMKSFLYATLPRGVRPRQVFGRIFRNKSGRIDVTPLRPLTQEEMELLEDKKKEKEKRNTIMKKIIMAIRANQ